MTPVTPRPAGTVVLLRDTPTGLAVYCQRRPPTMAFAAGAVVFPGGSVDPADSHPQLPWAGPDRLWWAAKLSCSPSLAGGYVSAAIRETCEETGVLYASNLHQPQVVVAEEFARRIQQQLLAGTPWDELLTNHELILRTDLLWPWARWITPPGRPRRYDTCFFTARVPSHQTPQLLDAVSEAQSSGWYSPQYLLDAADTGAITLLPPTRAMLHDCLEQTTVGPLLTTARTITPIIGPGPNRSGPNRSGPNRSGPNPPGPNPPGPNPPGRPTP